MPIEHLFIETFIHLEKDTIGICVAQWYGSRSIKGMLGLLVTALLCASKIPSIILSTFFKGKIEINRPT